MFKRPRATFALILAAGFAATPASAEPPWRRDGAQRDGRYERDGRSDVSVSIVIGDPDRREIRSYYDAQFRGGHCPPGLAKKNNGCMSPGQARKWQIGRPLPRDVVFHALPRELELRLNVPAGGRYVRAGADILLLAIGTGMVLDAIENLTEG